MERTVLPTIDLSRFINGGTAGRRAVSAEIAHACEEMGFFYLAGHGVAPEDIAAAQAEARAFFVRPREEKLRVARPQGRYRGYIPVSQFAETAEGRPPILYEAFLVGEEVAEDDPAVAASGGLLMPNLWPREPRGFRDAVLAYQAGVRRAAEELLRAFALALGAEETRLLRHFGAPLSNLSLLHYPPRAESAGASPDDACPHHDTNALTILLPGEVGGLEAQRPDGAWMAVPPRQGCFVVNLGNMLACWSGGRFKSTLHRVQPPLGVDRYAIGYFAVPDYETVVAPLDPEAVADAEVAAPIHAGKDLAGFVASCDAMAPVEA